MYGPRGGGTVPGRNLTGGRALGRSRGITRGQEQNQNQDQDPDQKQEDYHDILAVRCKGEVSAGLGVYIVEEVKVREGQEHQQAQQEEQGVTPETKK